MQERWTNIRLMFEMDDHLLRELLERGKLFLSFVFGKINYTKISAQELYDFITIRKYMSSKMRFYFRYDSSYADAPE